jgi:tetratricopeptide (TPR) repeat protein
MCDEIDFSRFHNPYDFANPVGDEKLFAGRVKQLEEITYYLNHAQKAPRAINLAILGDRASGKTSLLNMIEIEAKNRSLCPVRIDLNENDATSPLELFYKIFSAIYETICECKNFDDSDFCFGGRKSKIHDVYLDMITCHIIPDDREWCPFFLPMIYAKTKSKETSNPCFPEDCFKKDLIILQKEIGKPLILLFDECNVLSNNRTLLEMIRNIFMNLSGYMLVFAGTYDLFPVMDEIFSPIVRQFKKIEVGALDKDEIEDCIVKPLELIGGDRNIFDLSTYFELKDAKSIANGKPYELNLLCHLMFKRMQEGKAKKMILSIEVLDDVLSELRKGKDLSCWPVITKIKKMSKKELMALDFLTSSNGKSNFEQLWFIEYAINGENIWSKNEILDYFKKFEEEKIISLKSSNIHFTGDYFEKIYCKYFARQQDVSLSITEMDFKLVFKSTLAYALNEFISEISPFRLNIIIDFEANHLEEYKKYIIDLENKNTLIKLIKNNQMLFEFFYDCILCSFKNNKNHVDFVFVIVKCEWESNAYTFCLNTSEGSEIKDLREKVKNINNRASELGGEIFVEFHSVNIFSSDELIDIIIHNDQNLSNRLAKRHHYSFVKFYFMGKESLDDALFHLELCTKYDWNHKNLNNCGYLYIAKRDFKKAKKFLTEALSQVSEKNEKALSLYNLSIVELMLGNIPYAIDNLKKAIEICETCTEEDNKMGCLFAPIINDKKIDIEELRDPDLSITAKNSLEFIEALEI